MVMLTKFRGEGCEVASEDQKTATSATGDFASMLGASWCRLISTPEAQAEYNLRDVRPVFGLYVKPQYRGATQK
jgi:hypothetical protein